MAMKIVEESGGQYHVLLIIADGQVNHTKRAQNIGGSGFGPCPKRPGFTR